MTDKQSRCREMYRLAFGNDGAFEDALFDGFFERDCHTLFVGGQAVAMLFALDVAVRGQKGKYLYAVTTHPDYRGQGLMHRLFEKTEERYRDSVDFFCLLPQDEVLRELYQSLGYKNGFFLPDHGQASSDKVCLDDLTVVFDIRRRLAGENAVEFSPAYLALVRADSDFFCDDLHHATCLTTRRSDGLVCEVLPTTLGEQRVLVKWFHEPINEPILFSYALQ